jgi:hypothetical protein
MFRRASSQRKTSVPSVSDRKLSKSQSLGRRPSSPSPGSSGGGKEVTSEEGGATSHHGGYFATVIESGQLANYMQKAIAAGEETELGVTLRRYAEEKVCSFLVLAIHDHLLQTSLRCPFSLVILLAFLFPL